MNFIEIIVLIALIASMLFSKNITIQIISMTLFLVYFIGSKLLNHFKRKKLINEINDSKKIFISCKESCSTFLLMSFIFILNSIISIKYIINTKTSYLSSSTKLDISGIIDYISRFPADKKSSIIMYLAIIILALSFAVEKLRSFAIITDDKIIFYDCTVFYFTQITKIKYKHHLFSSKKVIRLCKNYNENDIILKLEDFENVRKYLENNVSI